MTCYPSTGSSFKLASGLQVGVSTYKLATGWLETTTKMLEFLPFSVVTQIDGVVPVSSIRRSLAALGLPVKTSLHGPNRA